MDSLLTGLQIVSQSWPIAAIAGVICGGLAITIASVSGVRSSERKTRIEEETKIELARINAGPTLVEISRKVKQLEKMRPGDGDGD